MTEESKGNNICSLADARRLARMTQEEREEFDKIVWEGPWERENPRPTFEGPPDNAA